MQKIETARLYLRQFTPDNLDDLYRIYSDVEVGYVLVKAYWGKGLASEVAAASLK